MTWYVYALCEPTTGAVRYVGKSSNPARRLESHCAKSAASAMREWVARVGEPTLRILTEHVDETAAFVAERDLIKEHWAAGAQLLNKSASGACHRRPRVPKFTGFGQRVRETRKRLGMGQDDLSAASGIERPALSRLENSHRLNPSAAFAVLIARALDVSVEWLVTGSERVSKASAA